MHNIRLDLEYDGTDFSGWQRQPRARTVQGVLEAAVATVYRRPGTVWGCARTDAGVHATGYVANFHAETEFPLGRLPVALNGCLPDDVAVRHAEEVPPDFHARFSARARRYRYLIATEPTAVWRHFAYRCRHELDVAAMAAAGVHLLGEHDFTSFTAVTNEADPVCRLAEARVEAHGPRIEVTVESNRFLYHMVRVIAGTLMEVGKGRIAPERVAEILRTRNRRAAGPTAPALGLTLVSVRYE
jgi:tRNA pseudouridine38-40 synthase